MSFWAPFFQIKSCWAPFLLIFVREFAQVLREIVKVFRDFARILQDFARIFTKSNFWGWTCTPCNPASYTREVSKQCTANTRNQAESFKGSSAMERRAQMQSYVNQTELTSELNLRCNYFAFVERQFPSKINW